MPSKKAMDAAAEFIPIDDDMDPHAIKALKIEQCNLATLIDKAAAELVEAAGVAVLASDGCGLGDLHAALNPWTTDADGGE